MSEETFPQELSDGAQAPQDRPHIPGVDDAVVAAAGIRQCGYPECEQLTGSLHGGLLIPYRDLQGLPIMDLDGAFYHLRLDVERGGKKYHQRAGTKFHAYLTPGLGQLIKGSLLCIIEGEKKALALDSMGLPALGITGFYGLTNGQDGFVDEFIDVLEASNFRVIRFFGDSDTIFNPQFSDAVAKVVGLLSKSAWAHLQLFVSVVPLDAPGKGIDDVRATLGPEFAAWFDAFWNLTVEVTPGMTKGRIACQLLELQRDVLERLAIGDRKDWIFAGLAKLAAGLGDPLAEEEIRELAESLGFTKRAFSQAITRAKKFRQTGGTTFPEATGVKIDLDQPAGIWVRGLLEQLRGNVFLAPDGKLSRLVNGELVPFNEKELIPYLDQPGRFYFVHGESSDGRMESVAKFEKKHAEVVLGASVDCAEVLRPVRVCSKLPVLVDDGAGGCVLVTDYSLDHKILVASATHYRDPITHLDAWRFLDRLVSDFSFTSPADKAAYLALSLTPALAQGGFLHGRRVPFFVISKDQRGAGGGTGCQLVSLLYGQRPAAIVVRDPGRVYESISKALFGGSSILYLDNVRGLVLSDLPFLESFLTEPFFDGRMIYRHGQIDVTRVTLMATSNGMILSEDLADRVVETRIQKQPSTHTFIQWPEGDLLSHVVRYQEFYLACVHTIVRAWVEAGRPLAPAVSGIRFKEWEAVLGGILAMRPHEPLVMFPDGERGRRRMTDRLSSPDFERVESLCRDLVKRGADGHWLTAREIAELLDDRVTVNTDELEHLAQMTGIMLTNFCPVAGELKDVGESFKIQRRKHNRPEKNYKATNEYIVVETSKLCDTTSTLTPESAG